MIKQPWNRFGENTSVAPSKSSKTIRSKFVVTNQEDAHPAPLYFKDDPTRDEIILRARKETNRISPQPRKEDPFGKVSKIVSDLQKKREQAKKRLECLKEQAEKQMDKKYTFMPDKKKIPKYVVSGDVLRRNQIWMQQKTKKHLLLKQQRTIEQLKNCTFNPNFESKRQSQFYLKNRTGKSLTPQKNSISNYQNEMKLKGFYSPIRNKKNDISVRQFQTAKKYLVAKIMNTHIL